MTTGHKDYLQDLWDLLPVNFDDVLENPPIEDETHKAPTSEWAFDHNADVNRHHTKFTIAEHDLVARHALAVLDPLVCSEAEANAKIIGAFENPPIEDEAEKAPTSEWAFDHNADAHRHRAYGSYAGRAVDTEYQAGEDGIVVAYLNCINDGDRGALDAKEGAVSGALNRRSLVSAQYVTADNIRLGYMSVTFPVKKDHYWEVFLITYGTTVTGTVFWIPTE